MLGCRDGTVLIEGIKKSQIVGRSIVGGKNVVDEGLTGKGRFSTPFKGSLLTDLMERIQIGNNIY